MNKFLIFFLLVGVNAFSQTDHNGNPIFNSVAVSEETINGFKFLSNYYTLKNNIENKGSSVYISDKPTLDEIENAAINLPSEFFLIVKDQNLLAMILIRNLPKRQYFVVNPATRKQLEFPCSLRGDITENRANEIIKQNYDSKAEIKNGKLFFNGAKLKIISNEEIRKDVLELIDKQKLHIGDTSNIKLLTKEEIRKIVLEESKEGGKLDFFTEIKGHEYDGIEVKPGLVSTKLGLALYKWGRALFTLRVNKVEEALELWAEFKGRQANEREKSYITMGFNRELEK